MLLYVLVVKSFFFFLNYYELCPLKVKYNAESIRRVTKTHFLNRFNRTTNVVFFHKIQ